jgi:tetratricopeptide (TPR) repeat protein
MAQVYIYQQKWAEARECLSRSQAIITEVGAADYLSALERRWGEFWLGTGEQDKALEHVRRSVELAKSQVNPLEEGKAYRMLGQVYLAQGNTLQAEQALAHSLKVLTNYYIPYEAARTRTLLARVALACGDHDHAKFYLDEAQNIFKSLNSKYNLAEVRKLSRQLESLLADQVTG